MASASPSAATLHVEANLEKLERITEPHERSQVLLEIGLALRDDLGDHGQAADALLEAVRSWPRHDGALDALEPLLRAQGRFGEAVAVLQAQAAREREVPRALACAEVVVRWLTSELGRADLARAWVERIRGLDTTHWLVHFLDSAAARERGDAKRELQALDFAVLSARRADDRARIHLLMAARYLEERTIDLGEAKKHFAAAHKLEPKRLEPLRGLEHIATRENDKVALGDVLRRASVADVPGEERVEILLRLARLEETEFKKPELAARTLERALDLAPGHAEALAALERCYFGARAWPELASVLERAATSTADPERRRARLARLGEVLETRLGDARAAVATYTRLATAFPDDETLLAELARLTEKTGDVTTAAHARARLASLARDPHVRARHLVVAGQLLVPVDPAAARASFERAVEADATNAAAWSALVWDARAANDTPRVLRYLEARAEGAETPRARGMAWVELAEARARAGDRRGARDAYEAAWGADDTSESAANALLAPLLDDQRWEELDTIVSVSLSGAERDKDDARLLAARRAEIALARAQGRPLRELVAARAAYRLAPGAEDTSEALARAAFAMRADPVVIDARAELERLGDAPDHLGLDGRVMLADVLALLGDTERAGALYDLVLADAPENDRALRGLSQIHGATGNRVAALSLRRQIARGTRDPGERFELLVEIADAFATRAGAPELAEEVYEEARVLRPAELPILHKLVALRQELGRWQGVFDALAGIEAVDKDPQRRSKTLFTMAQIALRELTDRRKAIDLFDRVLDVDPKNLEAFERIVRLLTEDKDWLALDQMYERMARRAASDTSLHHALLKQVAVLRRDRLGDPARAAEALRVAIGLAPKDDEAQIMLREILSRTGQAGSAVQVTLDRILRDPLDPTPYPAYFDLLVSQGARDRAVCAASVMRFLGVAHAPAENLLTAYLHPPIEGILQALGDGGYEELLHPDLDPELTTILSVVAGAAVDLLVSRLPLRERLGHPGPKLDDAGLVKLSARSASLLGAPAPKLYRRRAPGPAFAAAATRPASLVVFPPALLGVPRDVLTFVVGKRVVEVTPQLFARALCPSLTELKGLVASAARIAAGAPEAGDVPLRDRLKKDDLARLSLSVDAAMQRSGKLDVLRWAQLADVSASRAGLLLAGSVDAARAAIALEPQAPGDLSPREKLRELVVFHLGDASASLRKRLGVAL